MARELAPSALRPVPRRGLRREEAAMYVGVSPSKFGRLVEDGRMPRPFAIDGCQVWDVRALDAAFDVLAGIDQAPSSEWDDVRL